MRQPTVKARYLSEVETRWVNLPVKITENHAGEPFLTVRLGGTGAVLSMKPEEARRLADKLHDRLDEIDNQKGTNHA